MIWQFNPCKSRETLNFHTVPTVVRSAAKWRLTFWFRFQQVIPNSLFWSWCQRFVFVLKRCSLGLIQYKTRQIWGIWKLRPAYSPETPNLGQNRWCFVPCDLEIWWMTLENNRASLLCCFKLCATFHSHWWIQTGVTVRKRPNLGQIRRFLELCDLAIWCMTLKNNRAPLLFYFKLCASFRNHWCIETWVTVRKRQIWVKFVDF